MKLTSITIHYFCKPKSSDSQYEIEDINIVVDFEFIPVAGMFIKVTPNGDYLEVGRVYIDTTKNSEGVVIYVDEPEEIEGLWEWTAMEKEGWILG